MPSDTQPLREKTLGGLRMKFFRTGNYGGFATVDAGDGVARLVTLHPHELEGDGKAGEEAVLNSFHEIQEARRD